MKKLNRRIFVVVSILFLATTTQALPVEYTLSGTVFRIDGDAYLANDAGIYVDSAVSFTILMDVAQDGYSQKVNGEIVWYEDFYYGGDLTYDYFYADQVAGTSFGMSPPTVPTETLAYYKGWDNRWDQKTTFLTGSPREYHELIGYDNLEDLVLGEYFYGTSALKTSSGPGPYAYVRSDLTLQSIVVVPEPSSILLLASGLIGLSVWRKR